MHLPLWRTHYSQYVYTGCLPHNWCMQQFHLLCRFDHVVFHPATKKSHRNREMVKIMFMVRIKDKTHALLYYEASFHLEAKRISGGMCVWKILEYYRLLDSIKLFYKLTSVPSSRLSRFSIVVSAVLFNFCLCRGGFVGCSD